MEQINRQTGLIGAILFHLIILLIPVSLKVNNQFKEVELFVMGEVAQVQTSRIKQRAIEKPLVKETVPFNEPEQIRLPEETPVMQDNHQNVIETAAVSETPSAHSYPPIPEVEAASAGTPQPQVTSSNRPASPIDTEFGLTEAPKFLRREIPRYPMMARRLGKEANVVLRLTIDENGKLLNVEVLKGADYGFTESAVEAVKRSRFLPATRDGQKMASRAILPIGFILKEAK
ncbi:MAG: energy transducer TonB [Nitrospirae bacterium]|nr:energy transducer TonB [Nitrospirota bacterium]